MTRLDNLLFCVAAGFLVSYAALRLILAVWRRQLPPRPAEFHHLQHTKETPAPRYGGAALAAAFAALIFLPWKHLGGFSPNPQLWVVAGTALAMFGLGFGDDVRALGAKPKLAGQLLILGRSNSLATGGLR